MIEWETQRQSTVWLLELVFIYNKVAVNGESTSPVPYSRKKPLVMFFKNLFHIRQIGDRKIERQKDKRKNGWVDG